MQATKKFDGNNCTVTVTFDKAEVENLYNKTLSKLARTAKIAGFRPGKAPTKLVETQYGKDAIFSETVNEIINDAFSKGISETNVEFLEQPKLDLKKCSREEGAEVEFVGEAIPPVAIEKYKGLTVSYAEGKLDESLVEKDMNSFLERFATEQTSEEPSVSGNTVVIDFHGYDTEGNEIEKVHAHDYPVRLGRGGFIEGFEDALIGVKADDKKEVTLKFPDDYRETDLAGKEVKFAFTIKDVKKVSLPELTDDFIKEISGLESVEALKDDIRKHMSAHINEENAVKAKNALLDHIAGAVSIEPPAKMIDIEARKMLRDTIYRLVSYGMKAEEVNQEELLAEAQEPAKKKAKSKMILKSIAELENIKVEQQDIDSELDKLAATYRIKRKEVVKRLSDSGSTDMLIDGLLANKVLDYIYAQNTVKGE